MNYKGIIIALTFLLTSFWATGNEYYQVRAKVLNVRSGPGLTYPVVSKFSFGDSVLIDSIDSGWGQVINNGKIGGYAYTKYLSKNFKAKSKHIKAPKKESNSWVGTIIVIILIIYILGKVFGGDSGKSSKNKTVPKVRDRVPVSTINIKTPIKQNMETIRESIPKHNNVYCKYCGQLSSTVQMLTGGNCRKNPDGQHHVVYEGSEKSQYICKYCGHPASSIQMLTGGHCLKNQTGFCEPAL